MSLQSLIYVSSAKKAMSDDAIRHLLNQSRTNNLQSDITSMLLYRDGFFMQAIEGEGDKVDYLFDKIAMDDRHEDIVVVYKKPIKHRSMAFENLPMALDIIDEEGHDKVDGIKELDKDAKPVFFAHPMSQAEAMLADFRTELFF